MHIGNVTYAVIVPTLNAGNRWVDWIQSLQSAGVVSDDVYIVDSGSSDGTAELSKKAGFNVEIIDKRTFNHGGTRQRVFARLSGYEFVVYLTQDAFLHDDNALYELFMPFRDECVGAVCGRQLPNINAGPIEAHARLFNYPDVAFVRSLEDRSRFGLKAAFLSNSFTAYRVSALQEVGGFPNDVISTEDMYVATKMLLAGWKIAYAPQACVYHSHNYTYLQELRRYFDLGVFHSREPWIREELGEPEGEGVRFIRSEWNYLFKHAWWKIPESVVRSFTKYFGYRLGLLEVKLPIWVKRKLTANPLYYQ